MPFADLDVLYAADLNALKATADAAKAVTDNITAGAWSTYVPALAGITLGNGTVEGRYARIGRTIHAEILVTIGSTTTGIGAITATLPTTAARSKLVGTAVARPISAGSIYQMAAYSVANATLVAVGIIGASGVLSNPSSTTPAAWATAGWLLIQVTYESAA